MAKRTGLGRGIGALIPTAESSEARPVDVFFPGASTATEPAPAAAFGLHRIMFMISPTLTLIEVIEQPDI